MRTIEVAVELAEQLRDWSEPVRVRFVDDPVPMLELQTAGTLPVDFATDDDVEVASRWVARIYDGHADSAPCIVCEETARAALLAVADARRTEEEMP